MPAQVDQFQKLSVSDLLSLFAALGKASDAILSVVDQPRTSAEVGALLDREIDRFDTERGRIADELSGRPVEAANRWRVLCALVEVGRCPALAVSDGAGGIGRTASTRDISSVGRSVGQPRPGAELVRYLRLLLRRLAASPIRHAALITQDFLKFWLSPQQ